MDKKQKTLTLSLIIPVYNEEDYLGNCLESIARQTVKPIEVIVVDNNSTDSTAKIAGQYGFVRVIKEKRQHQSFAQHTGFACARGDIIGRIDADTVLPEKWVERNVRAFSNDPGAVAFNGSGRAYDIASPAFGEFIFKLYYKISARFAGHNLMWGSNCAFRRSTWSLIRDDLLLRSDIWEDYDLGFCLAKHGRVENIGNPVGVSYRAVHRSPIRQFNYQTRSVRTFYYRKGLVVASLFAVAWSSTALIGLFAATDYYMFRPIKNIYWIRFIQVFSR